MIHRDSIEFTTALALGAVLGVSVAYLLSSLVTGGSSGAPRLVARTRVGGDVEIRLPSPLPDSTEGVGRSLLRRLAGSGGTRGPEGNGRRG